MYKICDFGSATKEKYQMKYTSRASFPNQKLLLVHRYTNYKTGFVENVGSELDISLGGGLIFIFFFVEIENTHRNYPKE